MKLILKRIALRETYTIGKLSIDNVYFCDTLEDKVRDYNKDGDLLDKGETKIFGETAIPYGIYKVIVNMSPKFGRLLPRLLGVKHFDGILMHRGRTSEHTHGCVLVGENKVVGQILNGQYWEEKLVEILLRAQNKGEEITIEII